MKKSNLFLAMMLLIGLMLPSLALSIGDAGFNLSLDGIDDVVVVPDSAWLDSLAQSYTIELWIKANTSANLPHLLERDKVFMLYISSDNRVAFRSLKDGGFTIYSDVNAVKIGQWQHIAVRRMLEGSIYKCQIFVDGVKSGLASDNINLALIPNVTALTLGNNLELNRPFSGKIDEIRLWNLGRSDLLIKNLRGKSLAHHDTLGLVAYYKLDDGSGQIVSDSSGNKLNGWLGATSIADLKDPAWEVSTAPIGFNLLVPNQGVLNIAEPLDILWSVNPVVKNVNVLFSVDGGLAWNFLAYRTPNDGSFQTFVPGYPTTKALFMVADTSDTAAYDKSDVPLTFKDLGGWKKTVTVEAESGVLTKPMKIGVDGFAFGCEFIYSYRDREGLAKINVNIPANGLYIIWARALGPGSTRNSFFVRVDNGPEYLWDTTKKDEWLWDWVSHRGTSEEHWATGEVDPILLNLSQGTHTITVRGREHYTRLDRLRLTNDLTATYYSQDPEQWVNLLKPPDKARVVAGSKYEITWESQDIDDKVTLELSYDYGITFPTTIVKATDNDGSYLWQVPDTVVEKAIIRISEGKGGSCPMDENWEYFSIVEPQPLITVTAPNGDEIWEAGSSQNITWTSQDIAGNVKIDYTTQTGMILEFDGVNDFGMIPGYAALDRIEDSTFTIETWIYPLEMTTEARIIDRTNNFSVYLAPGNRLGFANLGKNPAQHFWTLENVLQKGKWQQITINSDGKNLRLFVNGFDVSGAVYPATRLSASDSPIYVGNHSGDGKYDRPFKGYIDELAIYDIGLYDANFPTSESPMFQDAQPEMVLLLHLNTAGNYAINEVGDNMRLGSTNTADSADPTWRDWTFPVGSGWKVISANKINDGTFAWTVPNTITLSGLVRVAGLAQGEPMDSSNAFFMIAPNNQPVLKMLSPNGGQVWKANTKQTVLAGSLNFTGNINLDLSLDDGTTWFNVASNIPVNQRFEWLVPNMPSAKCRMKATAVTSTSLFDLSDSTFTILPPDIPPVKDYALKFDGKNDFLEVANHPSLNVATRFTIEFWIKTSNPNQRWTQILEKGSYDEYSMGFYGWSAKIYGALRIKIEDGSEPINSLLSEGSDPAPGENSSTYKWKTVIGPSKTLLQPDEWFHVAATYDGKDAKIYINGIEEESKTCVVVPRTLTRALIIGAVRHGSTLRYHVDATLDELRIWNIARTPEQINSTIYGVLAGTEAGLVAYYPFDEGTGQIADDKSGNTNQARLGLTAVADDADPTWVASDRPEAPTAEGMSMAKSAPEAVMAIPDHFGLSQNYPNPFNAGTNIIYDIPEVNGGAIDVKIEIFDLQGRLIRTLVQGVTAPGSHQIYWDGRSGDGAMAASAVYFYRMRAGNFTEIKRMILLK